MIDLTITNCDIADMYMDTVRFLCHMFLLHIISYSINSKEDFLDKTLLQNMLFTTIAVILYHICLKKLFIKSIKKLKNNCDINRDRFIDNTIKQ